MSTTKKRKESIYSKKKKSVISTKMSVANEVERSPNKKWKPSTPFSHPKKSSWLMLTARSGWQQKNSWLSNTAMMGVLHLIGGVFGTWWWLAVIIYYIIKKSSFSNQDMDVFYSIINFNLSFLLYALLSGFLVIILIGIPMLIVVSVAYIVLLVISSLHYITDRNYSIPFSIHILK